MIPTTIIPFPLLPRLPMFVFSYLWLLCNLGLCIRWTSKMPSYMATWQRRSIWSNHLGLLLRESRLVCRLHRSLYGLKQSPRAWFDRFSSVVQEFGMTRSTTGHSVFYHHTSSRQCIYLIVYVDDMLSWAMISMAFRG